MKNVFYMSALCALLLSACATMPTPSGYKYIEEKPLPEFENPTLDIPLATWTKEELDYNHKLRVYIDGDVLASDSANKAVVPYPIAGIAEKDPYPFSLVLGRPCYYITHNKCQKLIWDEGRFMPEIIAQMQIVLERWGKRYHPSEIELVGYDTGAAVALLLAPRIKNVPVSVITFGGILDTDRYVALKNGKDLYPGSLNPTRETDKLASIPQIHYVGGQDTVAPKRLTDEFVSKIASPKSIQVRLVPQATHDNWNKFIVNLINQPSKAAPVKTQTAETKPQPDKDTLVEIRPVEAQDVAL